jgi:hypothetical protein
MLLQRLEVIKRKHRHQAQEVERKCCRISNKHIRRVFETKVVRLFGCTRDYIAGKYVILWSIFFTKYY